MPTIDPIKNLEYVKKSQIKKKETLGADAYNRDFQGTSTFQSQIPMCVTRRMESEL
jgi:hypothetical protein